MLHLREFFLVAIATFMRCSDLQSLRIDKKSIKERESGITFIRHGLSKQDRQSHFGMKIHVPRFWDRPLLDPKRCLKIYLDRTEDFRIWKHQIVLSCFWQLKNHINQLQRLLFQVRLFRLSKRLKLMKS